MGRMKKAGSESPTRGVGWLLAHPGWSGIGGLIAIAGLIISLWPASDQAPGVVSPATSVGTETVTPSPTISLSIAASSTTAAPATTTTLLEDVISALDVGTRPSVFESRLGEPTRIAPMRDSAGDPVGGSDLVTWRLTDIVVEAVVDTNDDVVRGYTVTPLARSPAFSVPHLPDTSQVIVGEAFYADVNLPTTGRQGVNPPNGRFHYAEAFYAGASTDYRVVVLITSHVAPVELVNRSTSEAFDGFRSIHDCLGFDLTELPCGDRPGLAAVRTGMVVTGYAIADPGFENHLALFPEDL